jgi:GntR family transcriptional regulator, rspAB operon transcriptional repressor
MVLTDTQRAYELIKQKIITTTMSPGAVIQEAALMSELELGRTPIREALKLLEAERLVAVSPRRGMFVTPINISDLTKLQEIRSVLDLLSVRLAALRVTAADLAQMRAWVEQARTAGPSGDMRALMDLDHRFHQLLAAGTHNELLADEDERVYNLSVRIWYYYLDQLCPDDLALEALIEVVEALERGDAGQAEAAMSRHISHYSDSIRRRM